MSPVAFAPTSVRSLKMENGTSGSETRVSQNRKPPISKAAAVKIAHVVSEPQP